MQSVPITTEVVSSNPVHGVVYSIQHYVIKFASDLRQVVCGNNYDILVLKIDHRRKNVSFPSTSLPQKIVARWKIKLLLTFCTIIEYIFWYL